jgi:hypothetical protein
LTPGSTLDLAIVYSGSADAVDAADSLLKLSKNLRHADFSAAIIAPIAVRTYGGFDRFRTIIGSASVFLASTTSFAETGACYPLCIPGETDVFGPPPDMGSSPEFDAAVAMHTEISTGRADAALFFAGQLEGSDNLYYQVLGLHYGAHLLAQSLRLEDAIKKAVAIAIADRGAVQLLRTAIYSDFRLSLFEVERDALSSKMA